MEEQVNTIAEETIIYNDIPSLDEQLVVNGKNAKQIVCKLCDCVVLLPQKAEVEKKKISLQVDKQDNEDNETLYWFWKLKDMFDFENVGFTKPIDERRLKYLTCADCERGILGVQYLDESKQIFLAVDRVNYKD